MKIIIKECLDQAKDPTVRLRELFLAQTSRMAHKDAVSFELSGVFGGALDVGKLPKEKQETATKTIIISGNNSEEFNHKAASEIADYAGDVLPLNKKEFWIAAQYCNFFSDSGQVNEALLSTLKDTKIRRQFLNTLSYATNKSEPIWMNGNNNNWTPYQLAEAKTAGWSLLKRAADDGIIPQNQIKEFVSNVSETMSMALSLGVIDTPPVAFGAFLELARGCDDFDMKDFCIRTLAVKGKGNISPIDRGRIDKNEDLVSEELMSLLSSAAQSKRKVKPQ